MSIIKKIWKEFDYAISRGYCRRRSIEEKLHRAKLRLKRELHCYKIKRECKGLSEEFLEQRLQRVSDVFDEMIEDSFEYEEWLKDWHKKLFFTD